MTELRKELTLYGLTMVAIGSCIGSGIFLTPSQIVSQLPSPLLALLIWAIGGLITLTGALTFAELGSMFPQAGGVYTYLKEGYGEVFGFLYGWAYLLVITSGAIAALTIAFAQYLAFIFPMGQTGITTVAIMAIVVVTVVNIVRVKAAEVFSNVFTGLKLLGIFGLILVGLIWGKAGTMGAISSISESIERPESMITALGVALIGVLWSYGGWQHASFVAGEAIDARRTVPRAMIIGAITVTVVYLLANLAYFFLLPVESIITSSSVAADAISTIIPFGGTLIAIMIAISVFGTAGIYTLSAPRIYYAMASDGIFFKKLAEVHPRFRTPVNAILVQSTWAVALLLFWGTFENVITYVVFTDWIFFALTGATVFIFRKKRPDIERPYSTFGYPVTPIIFIGISSLFVINTLIERPLHALAGILFMVIGIFLFMAFKRRRAAESGQERIE
ncbi:APC family permease [Candidatus Zixiibacteriota bacterium]